MDVCCGVGLFYNEIFVRFVAIRETHGLKNQLNKIIALEDILNDYKSIYRFWRWCVYNELDFHDIQKIANGTHRILELYTNAFDSKSYPQYTNDVIEKFKKRDFHVSKTQISQYDEKVRKPLDYIKDEIHKLNKVGTPNSKFIENCSVIIDDYYKDKLINVIKDNLIHYYWWDEMNFDELSKYIVRFQFLRSTRELINNQLLYDYFFERFKTKEIFINHILENFQPSYFSLITLNDISRHFIMFHYRYIFSNDLKMSIRVFENECRFDFNEKIIGSFFNENLLFREIQKRFGNKYQIISQGSPEWLKPQRFDIYIPELNIAIEYQGEQHFRPVDFGGKGKKLAKKQFEENLRRDINKLDRAIENKCEIIYVKPKYKIDDVFREIRRLIEIKS